MEKNTVICPLCSGSSVSECFLETARMYLRCEGCNLVFVPEKYHMRLAEQRKRYDLHKNTLDNEGYTTFLGKLVKEVVKMVPPGATGLDFGSGPNPVLSILLQRAGYKMSIYDIFYADNPAVLDGKYDFVTCSETIEHVYDAAGAWKTLVSCAGEKGIIALMTKRLMKETDFSRWHYKNDLTHVCFYSDATLEWVARRYNYNLELVGSDMAVLTKIMS